MQQEIHHFAGWKGGVDGYKVIGTGADLWKGPGNFRGSAGNFRGSLGNFPGTSVREVPGKSPGNFQESLGKFWEEQGLSRSSGEPDSLPAFQRVPDYASKWGPASC